MMVKKVFTPSLTHYTDLCDEAYVCLVAYETYYTSCAGIQIYQLNKYIQTFLVYSYFL